MGCCLSRKDKKEITFTDLKKTFTPKALIKAQTPSGEIKEYIDEIKSFATQNKFVIWESDINMNNTYICIGDDIGNVYKISFDKAFVSNKHNIMIVIHEFNSNNKVPNEIIKELEFKSNKEFFNYLL